MNARVISRNAVFWLAGLVGLAAAQYVRAQEPVVDPPSRVARLSLMDGEVSLAPAGTEEWADGVLNRPITSGDRVWVGTDGRAELQIGTASVHLDRSTGFEFIELDDDVMQMSLTEGVATIRVRTLGDSEKVQLETPNATVHFLHPGDYTVQVEPDSDRTIVRTRNGEAEVTGASKSFRVRADQEGVFTGLDGLTANIGSLPPRTAFESWANDLRGRTLRFARSRRLRRSRRPGRMDRRARVRPRVAPDVRRQRLGAVSLRSLGLGLAVGLDLDRRRALGLRALPLWPLGIRTP